MNLICITGIDGAGKTTLAKSVVTVFQEEQVPAFYIYGRTLPVISRFLMSIGRKTFLNKHNQWNEYPKYNSEKKNVMRNSFLRIVYTISILLDYYIQIWFKLLPHIFSKRWIILDRYIYDTVISDLAVHLGYNHDKTKKMIENGLKLLPPPRRTFLIDLPPELAILRKDDIPHIDYLIDRRSYYLTLSDFLEVIVIDGGKPKHVVLQTLLSEMRVILKDNDL